MAMKVLFCNGSQEKVAFNEMLCSLMEKAAIETAVVFGKLAGCLLAMGTLSNGLNMMGNEVDIKQGDEDSFPVEVKQKVRKGVTQLPSQKDDGETDDDDDDDEDEDADDQDDYGGEDDLSGEEGNDNEGDEDPADEVEANGEGGSDDGDEDGEDDDEDDDDDDDDDDDGDEEDEDEEDEEEIPEPPSKKRK